MSRKGLQEIENQLDALNSTIQEAVRKAYETGYNEGLGVKLPTQEEFDEAHKEVMPYGEEAEWLVLSKELYSEEEAYEKFKNYLEPDMDEEWMENVLDNLSIKGIGYKRPEGENEPIFWIGQGSGEFWDAWVVETGY